MAWDRFVYQSDDRDSRKSLNRWVISGGGGFAEMLIEEDGAEYFRLWDGVTAKVRVSRDQLDHHPIYRAVLDYSSQDQLRLSLQGVNFVIREFRDTSGPPRTPGCSPIEIQMALDFENGLQENTVVDTPPVRLVNEVDTEALLGLWTQSCVEYDPRKCKQKKHHKRHSCPARWQEHLVTIFRSSFHHGCNEMND